MPLTGSRLARARATNARSAARYGWDVNAPFTGPDDPAFARFIYAIQRRMTGLKVDGIYAQQMFAFMMDQIDRNTPIGNELLQVIAHTNNAEFDKALKKIRGGGGWDHYWNRRRQRTGERRAPAAAPARLPSSSSVIQQAPRRSEEITPEMRGQIKTGLGIYGTVMALVVGSGIWYANKQGKFDNLKARWSKA